MTPETGKRKRDDDDPSVEEELSSLWLRGFVDTDTNENELRSREKTWTADNAWYDMTIMPPLPSSITESLRVLEIYKFRYLTELHAESIGALKQCTHLSLARCSNLKRLPDTILNVSKLKTVRIL